MQPIILDVLVVVIVLVALVVLVAMWNCCILDSCHSHHVPSKTQSPAIRYKHISVVLVLMFWGSNLPRWFDDRKTVCTGTCFTFTPSLAGRNPPESD